MVCGLLSGLRRGRGEIGDCLLEEVGIVAAARFEDELAGRRALQMSVQYMLSIQCVSYIFVRHVALVVVEVFGGVRGGIFLSPTILEQVDSANPLDKLGESREEAEEN